MIEPTTRHCPPSRAQIDWEKKNIVLHLQSENYSFSMKSYRFCFNLFCLIKSESLILNRLVGLVVRHLPQERKIPGSNPFCAGIFLGSSHTSDFKIGTPVATLPCTWLYRVSTRTGRPGVSILWLGEVERWICNFYLSVAARKIVSADQSLRYTSLLLGRWATNKQPHTSSLSVLHQKTQVLFSTSETFSLS